MLLKIFFLLFLKCEKNPRRANNQEPKIKTGI